MDESFIVQGELIYYAHTLNPKFKELLLPPTSDLHKGHPLFSVRHFTRHWDFIETTPNACTLFNGDLIEAATKSSVGDVYSQIGTPQDQADWLLERVYKARKKILGMTTGNHEWRIYRETGFDVSKYIAKELGIPYRPEGILLKISFGNGNNGTEGRPYTYRIYATHGYGGARTKAAKAVKVERVATWIDADVYIMSHDHVVNIAPDVYLKPDPRTHLDEATGFQIGKVTASRKMLIKSNAFLKWGGYSEMGGFPPVDLETPLIKFKGTGKPRVKVEV